MKGVKKKSSEPQKESRIIQKVWFHQMPNQLTGAVIVIDAFAASANMSILLSKNPRRLVVVNEQNLKRARKLYTGSLLVGESSLLKKEEFTCSNELKDMYQADVMGKDVLWLSDNGSRVFEKTMATQNDIVVAGAFCNTKEVAKYFLNQPKDIPIIIIMAGNRGRKVDEDRLCADVIEDRLLNRQFDWNKIKREAEKGVRSYCLKSEADRNLPYLFRLDEFNIVPQCVINKDGFIEIRQASFANK